MITFLSVIHILTCVILVLAVLIQVGKDGGMGAMAGGSSQTVFGASGGANFLTKFTAIAAFIFMSTSLGLTLVRSGPKKSVFDEASKAKAVSAAPVTPDAAPATTPAAAPSATPTGH